MANILTSSLALKIYEGNTTTLRSDPYGYLKRAYSPEWKTYYSGGRYGECSFFIPARITDRLGIQEGDRVVLTLGLPLAYEGYISGLELAASKNLQGVVVRCVGGWGWIMMNYPINKIWCDTSVAEGTWNVATSQSGAELATNDRSEGRMRITPKSEQWANNDQHALRYDKSPTGQTIKRVLFDYDFQEGAQSWQGFLSVNSVTEWSITASGTGSQDITTSSPGPIGAFFFKNNSGGNQTPSADGTYYLEITNLHVHSETGNINMTEIAKDVVGILSAAGYLNSSETYITSPSTNLALEPFGTNGFESAADIIARAVSRGDGDNNRWAYGLLPSETVASPNGLPVLFLEQWPALTDYGLQVRLDGPNVSSGVQINRDADTIANYIIIRYTDVNGYSQYYSPADDATLTDSESIALISNTQYMIVDIGEGTATVAADIGARYLAEFKELQWRLASGLVIRGSIQTKAGNSRDLGRVFAGQRVKITNFLKDLSGVGAIFVITATHYEHASATLTLQFGTPDAPIFQPYRHPVVVGTEEVIDTVTETNTDSEQSGPEPFRWWRRLGMTKREWNRLTRAEKRRLKLEWERGRIRGRRH